MQTSLESRIQNGRDATEVICERIACVAGRRFARSLQSIVLTGSLAREEGTFSRREGVLRLVGDVDCFLVFRNGEPLPPESLLEDVSREIAMELAARGVDAVPGLDPVHSSWFAGLPKHIATYELRTNGRVIYGDPAILSAIPAFSESGISREDAWRMLGNRMIELLEAVAQPAEPGMTISTEVRYRAIKLYLDMATSYLVFAGCYAASYRGRERVLRNLAENDSALAGAPFPLGAFAEKVSACTAAKLDELTLPFSIETLQEAVGFARQLWKWELGQLTGETAETSESQLMLLWIRRQPLPSRVRGWVSVLRRSGWLRSVMNWPRWARLAWQASPRYWVYRIAAELFFAIPEVFRQENPHSGRLRMLGDKLPSFHLVDAESEWRSLALMAAEDYHRFLETTHS